MLEATLVAGVDEDVSDFYGNQVVVDDAASEVENLGHYLAIFLSVAICFGQGIHRQVR